MYAGGGSAPDFMLRAGVAFRFIKDHLGSVRFVVNTTTGIIAQALEYDDFGKVTRDTAPGFQPFAFAGGLYDADTGLVRFGARDYDATVGRWTSKDPIGFRGGLNLYAYCNGDPINFTDPSGEVAPFLLGLAAAGAFLAVFLADNDHAAREAAIAAPVGAVGGHFLGKGLAALAPLVGRTFTALGEAAGEAWSYFAKALAPRAAAAAEEVALFGTKKAAREALDGPLGIAANRFFRDAAKNAQDFRITNLADGGQRFEFFSPARNAGYGKQYVQEVDGAGAIVREFKNTLGPNGLIETKWVHGGP